MVEPDVVDLRVVDAVEMMLSLGTAAHLLKLMMRNQNLALAWHLRVLEY
jgi:hypothetical protein